LKLKNISDFNIKIALKEIDENDYLDTFNKLFEKINTSSKELNSIKRKRKILNYLLRNGWEKDLIYQKLNSL
jgi:regulatory protein